MPRTQRVHAPAKVIYRSFKSQKRAPQVLPADLLRAGPASPESVSLYPLHHGIIRILEPVFGVKGLSRTIQRALEHLVGLRDEKLPDLDDAELANRVASSKSELANRLERNAKDLRRQVRAMDARRPPT